MLRLAFPAVLLTLATMSACGDDPAPSNTPPPNAVGGGGSGTTDAGTGATTSSAAGGAAGVGGSGGSGGSAFDPEITVALFSKTEGFRHASIPDALEGISAAASAMALPWSIIETEDAAFFTSAAFGNVDVVVFLLTTGDVLDEAQQEALEEHVQAGGGWVGVHSASDTEYDWPWYGGLVGAYFDGHPAPQDAVVVVENDTHPATHFLDATWPRFDEWYSFATNPRPVVDVLLALDETTYSPGGLAMGDHPIAWSHTYDGGRAFYTAGGHTSESYQDPDFLQHVVGGILWAAGKD